MRTLRKYIAKNSTIDDANHLYINDVFVCEAYGDSDQLMIYLFYYNPVGTYIAHKRVVIDYGCEYVMGTAYGMFRGAFLEYNIEVGKCIILDKGGRLRAHDTHD